MELRIVAAIAVLAAALSACGGGSKSATPTSTRTAASSPSATRAAATPSAVAATLASAPPTVSSLPPTDVPPPAPPVATSTPVPPPPPPPPPPAGTTLTLLAQGTLFVPVSLSAPAGPITIVLDNRDAGIAHNLNVFTGDTSIASTQPAAGPVTESLSLGDLAPGSYKFACDVHPQAMHGVLTVS